ncbi:MAG: hypothetical protein K9K67_14465 [Bacteriovoracaceae bacterium]|nr:hypothetical protein [Bacteriovoracaceae bacterium]
MMMKLITTFMSILFLSFVSAGLGQVKAAFPVSIEGSRGMIESYQARAELKMARSTDFCRGYTMPKLSGSWQCRPSAKGKVKCASKFICKHINKSFSRVSESRRLTNELKKTGRSSSSFTMIVGKKPLRNPSKYRYVEQINNKRSQLRASEKQAIRTKIKRRTEKLKEEMTEYDEFAQLEKELAIETKPTTASQRKDSVDQLSSNALAEDRRQLEENQELIAPFRMEREKSNTSNEEIIRIKKREDMTPIDRRFQILSFSGAMARIQDNNASSVATADFAWTPRWQFGEKWALRGRLGGHFISAEIVDGEDSETFLVYDLAGDLEWFPFLGSGFYLNGGLGVQSWTSTTGGAFSTVSLGGGYLFDFNKAKIVDRVFFSYTSVGNEAANTELKVGIGVSF